MKPVGRIFLVVAGTVLAAAVAVATHGGSDDGEPEYPHGDFQGDCTQCHAENGWVPMRADSTFNHKKEAGYPLVGAHAQTDCLACHQTTRFQETLSSCVSCHVDVHRAELGVDCGSCHTPRSFIDRALMERRHTLTRFPLRGVHRATDCEDCHSVNDLNRNAFVNTPVDCEACHVDDYLATTDPNHAEDDFPRNCEQCHSFAAWNPAGFDHRALPPDALCVSCHLEDYQGTTDPDHETIGIDTTCEDCHTTRGWTPADFDHGGLPPSANCVDCHQQDYDGAMNPVHIPTYFPADCEECHNTRDWRPADFPDHDAIFFPIYSGKHREAWDGCNDCHMVPTNLSVFSCIDCHKHDNENEVNNQHENVSGYSYESQACLACHPTGDD